MAISSSLLSSTTTNTSSSSSAAAAAGTKHHSSQRIVRHHRHHQESAKDEHQQQKKRRKKKKQAAAAPPPPLPLPKPPSSWSQFKSLLTCKSLAPTQVHDPSTSSVVSAAGVGGSSRYGKLSSSCSSICTLKDVVVHGNTRVVHRGESDHSPPDTASSNCSGQLGPEARLLSSRSSTAARSTSRPASGASHHGSRGMPPLRKLSGCYECRAISDPIRYPMPRSTICTCPECGEVFTKPENLEQHQIVRHAVSELGPEDSGRNIVEIIFKSSWVKRELSAIDGTHPVLCKIDRILKVHNTQRTVTRFEEYREAVKSRAAMMLLHSSSAAASRGVAAAGKKNPRCAADGNELLRFHCATVSCSLGSRGSNSLCSGSSSGSCGVCSVIRHGFARAQVEQGKGVRTTASSGRAHDCCATPLLGETDGPTGTRKAMLVCRVIAGRIKRAADDPAGPDDDLPGSGGYDSVAGGGGGGRQTHFGSAGAGGKAGSGSGGGGYGNLEELFVANPRAILPCFVVIYRTIG